MAEPAIRDFPRLPRIDAAWRLPTEAELPYEDDEPLAESDYQLEPLGYTFYGLRGYFAHRADVAVHADMFVHYLRLDEHGDVRLDENGRPMVDRLAPDVFVVFGVPNRRRDSYVSYDEGKPPDFVLEVLSASTWRRDMGVKNERDSQAALLRTEAALRQAESARDEAEAGRRDAEVAARKAAERIAELEARLQLNDR